MAKAGEETHGMIAGGITDAFSSEEEEPELELKVTVININPGCNSELLKKCESLSGYMAFVASV